MVVFSCSQKELIFCFSDLMVFEIGRFFLVGRVLTLQLTVADLRPQGLFFLYFTLRPLTCNIV